MSFLKHDDSPNEMMNMIKQVVYIVEATDFEKHALWNQHAVAGEKYVASSFFKWKRVTWYSNSSGWLPTIGYVYGNKSRPVVLSLWFENIDGHVVMFYHATSQHVDWEMITEWLKYHVPQVYPKNDDDQERQRTTDPMNFHLCLNYLQKLNEDRLAALSAATGA